MDSTIEAKKQLLVYNVINFLQEELIKGNLNDERKESVEVALQCLETAFELDSETREKLESDKIDLLSLIHVKPKVKVSDQQKVEAEEHKNKGNTHMKNSEYGLAVEEYTNAIGKNPYNAIYYCNRAAAYSRQERHFDAINDCNEAIKLDPTYGKAYGRLGIAYSNLNKYDEARKAYITALKYDPANAMYETNLKLAEERICGNLENAAPPEHIPAEISQFVNNPNIINVATQMLNDPNFCNIMSGLISFGGRSGDPGMDALLQAGQTLASRMQATDPNFVETLRRTLDMQAASLANRNQNPSSNQENPNNPPRDNENTDS